MVVFCGDLSEKSKEYLLKENVVLGLIISIPVALIFCSITIFLAAILELWVMLIFLIPISLIFIFPIIGKYFQKEKVLEMIIPSKIVIDGNGDIRMFLGKEKTLIEKSFSKIKKVEEDDDWFYLKLRFPKIDGFLCQKNLITEGTIEEFEEIFKDKLVRKTTKTTKKNP